MTDSKEKAAAVKASKSASDKKDTARPDTTAASAAKSTKTKQQRPSRWRSAFWVLLLIFIVIGAAGWYWFETTSKQYQQVEELAQQSQRQAAQALQQANQALAQAATTESQLDKALSQFGNTSGRLDDLDKALQMLSDRGSDLVLLNDIDHLVTVAHQQLLLGGNVANAIIALETAQSQLARAARPAFSPLQQAINGDLDRLRATSTIDVQAVSEQLDALLGLVASAPLLIPDDAHPQSSGRQSSPERISSSTPVPTESASNDSWWELSWNDVSSWSGQAWDTVRNEWDKLVSVRRIDDSQALLLSAEQAHNLRDNLRLRVITARLALLMRESDIWKTELTAVLEALERRFDTQNREVRRAIRLTDGLLDTNIAGKVPSVDNTLQALETLRQADSADPEVRSNANDSETSAKSLQLARAAVPPKKPGPEAEQMMRDLKQDEQQIRSINRQESAPEHPGPEAEQMMRDLKQDEQQIRSINRQESVPEHPGPEAEQMMRDLKQDERVIERENQAEQEASKPKLQE